MTRTLTDVLANLILPPAGPLLLAFAGLVIARRWRRAGIALCVLGIAVLWILSLDVVGNWLVRQHEPPPVSKSDLATAEAIVVVGGGMKEHSPEYGAPVLDAEAFQRLRYAAHLARETGLPLLVSGGGPRGVAEADVMARTLKNEFALQARWIENASATTAENAARSFALLAPQRKTRIALVTTASHMPRAKRSFEAAGFAVVAAPTGYVSHGPLQPRDLVPSAGGLVHTRTALWEWLGSIWYALRR